VSKHSSKAPASIDWVALQSGAIAGFSAAAIAGFVHVDVAQRGHDGSPWLGLAEIAILAALTWVAVRLRFPFLIVVAVIAVGYPSVRQFATVSVIVCSHSLLARTRFFERRNGEWSKGFAGAASGWLAALSLCLFRGAHVNRQHGLQAWVIPLAAFGAAICFAIIAGFKARREAETTARRMPAWGRVVVSLFVGAAAFVLGLAVTLLTQLDGVGNSGSSAPGAWQSKPQLQQQPSTEPRQ
jgi:hypothetical protein